MTGTPREVDRDDPQFARFWEGTDAGELTVQRCGDCGRHRWPPRALCPGCHSFATVWAKTRPAGELFSWIDVRHPTVPGIPAPYTVGLVELADAPVRMLGRIVDVEADQVRIGMSLVARFDRSGSGITLVNWRPAGPAGHLR